MLRPTINIFISLLLFLASYAIAFANVLWEKGANQSIGIQTVNIENTKHPVVISKQNLTELLALLHAKTKKSDQTSPIFNDEQIQVLSKYVSTGLSNLRTNEAIYFSLSKADSSLGGLIKSEVFTAGTIYYTQEGLTVLIGDHERERDYSYEAIFDPSKKGLVKYEFDYGLANEQDSILLTLNPDVSSTVDFIADSNRIVVPTDFLKSLSTLNIQTTHQVSSDRSLEGSVSRTEVQKMIEDKPSLTKEEVREIVKETNVKDIQEQQSGKTSSNTVRTIEERFEILESLKTKGLITQEEYQQKRQELLSEL